MSQLTTIAGTVSGVEVSTTTTTSTTVSPNSSVPSTSAFTHSMVYFRVDNRPVYMTVRANVRNGDVITAAGHDKGEFEIIALRNHSTKTIYSLPEPKNMGMIVIGLVCGVMTIKFMGFGLLLIVLAIQKFFESQKKTNLIKDAWAMVEKEPAPSRN